MKMKVIAGLLLIGIIHNSFAAPKDCREFQAGEGRQENLEEFNKCERYNEEEKNRNRYGATSSTSGNSKGQRCEGIIADADKEAKKLVPINATAPTPTRELYPNEKADIYNAPKVKQCLAWRYMAASIGNTVGEGPSAPSQTFDGKAVCVKPEGFTLDADSCFGAKKLYDIIVVLDAGLVQYQQQQVQNNGQKLGAGVAAEAAKGNGQNASLNAAAQDNAYKGQLSMQQATAYGAAAAALSAKVFSWQKKDASSLTKKCSVASSKQQQPQQQGADQQPQPSNSVSEPTSKDPKVNAMIAIRDCPAAMGSEYRGGAEVFANESAKTFFTAAAFQYTQKAATALANARRFEQMAGVIKKVADNTPQDPNGPVLNNCVLGSTDPKCVTFGPRTPTSPGFEAGDFNVGDGGGNNNFGAPTGTETFGENGEESKPGDTVASVNNPFVDDAKKANDILNPAPAAQVKPGGAPGGGAGGGGAGGGGGGGSALGDDLKGADAGAEKTEDIKAEKLSGSYASGGGSGFSAVKGGGNEANPFASLFDGKKGEGRSTASEDLDVNPNKDMVLFQIISRKHAQVHADKRIEANNLE